MTTPRLSVLIATYRPEGIGRVEAMHLPQVDGVEYVVSWQEHLGAPIPPSLSNRPDMHIHRYDTKGVSNNRNNAIAHAAGDIMLMADDDLIYTPRQLQAVIETFAANPTVEYASFMYECPQKKNYPASETDISRPPRFFYQTCFEVAVRRSPRTAALRFSPDFGPGATPLTCGEDEMLYLRARRLGLKCRFFPVVITSHPQLSTGQRPATHHGILQTNGALIALNNPRLFWAKIPVNAMRLRRQGRAPFFKALVHMCRGAAYALRTPSIRNYANPTPAAR